MAFGDCDKNFVLYLICAVICMVVYIIVYGSGAITRNSEMGLVKPHLFHQAWE